VLVIIWLTLGGCASSSGWSVSAARTCAPKTSPRVCVRAEPDHGHVIEFADVALLPGECAEADDEARAGLLRVRSRDPERQERRRWLSTRSGKATIITVDADGKLAADRQSCDLQPISLAPPSRTKSPGVGQGGRGSPRDDKDK
jgi:hypothetical protein